MNRKEIPFDTKIWNDVDEWLYPDEKFPMAVWLLNHHNFTEKTADDICIELYEGNCKRMESNTKDNIISIPLRNWSETAVF